MAAAYALFQGPYVLAPRALLMADKPQTVDLRETQAPGGSVETGDVRMARSVASIAIVAVRAVHPVPHASDVPADLTEAQAPTEAFVAETRSAGLHKRA